MISILISQYLCHLILICNLLELFDYFCIFDVEFAGI